jgi:carbamoyltransferase
MSGGKLKPYRLDHVFLGPSIATEGLEEKALGQHLTCTRRSNINETIAQHLADGKVVARVTGAIEYGPRALGHRSVLYQAIDPTVNDWLNKKLNRTEFMPFAPMLLEEDALLLLKGYSDKNSHAAEFMTITYDVTDLCRHTLPAVVHVDGTARPQIIRKETNPDCYEILRSYKSRTGLLALINTSYNLHDEPIVQSPEDAVRAFRFSHLDVLVLDDCEITLSDPERAIDPLELRGAGSGPFAVAEKTFLPQTRRG